MNEIDKLADIINEHEQDFIQDGSLERPFVDSRHTLEQAIEAIKQNKPECPPEILENLSLVTVEYLGFDDKFHEGQILVHQDLQTDIQDFFKLAISLKFPIEVIKPISEFNDDDEASMSKNNSSGFNFRKIAGKNKISLHGFGFAIDINPRMNPFMEYVTDDSGNRELVATQPQNGEYNVEANGTLSEGHPLVEFLKERGWIWGGDWEDYKDFQHFEKSLATEEYLANLQLNLENGEITPEQFEQLSLRAHGNSQKML